jgi:hypothetical protein
MSEAVPGLTQQQFRDATNRLAQAATPDQIEELIEKDPLFLNPILHRVWNAQINDDLARIKDRIDLFYALLALRVHRQIFDSVPRLSTDQQSRPAHRVEYRPPYFAGIMELLGHAAPKHEQWRLDPAKHSEQITVELSEAIGREVGVPPYAPLDGSLWNAVVVVCAACRMTRVDVRAYYVDLVTAPELQTPLAEGVLNSSRCPHCGESVAIPSRVWLSEHPAAPDTLAGMSSIWRSASGAMVFQAPAGTQRRTETEHLMMYRAMTMLQAYRWPSPHEAGEVRVTLAVAYSDEELRRLLLEEESASGGLPRWLKALWDYTAADMRSGQYPFDAAEGRVVEEVFAEKSFVDWALPGLKQADDLEAFRRLALCFIREALARKNESAPAIRAFFAGETCGAFRNLGQPALAKAALARAQELLAKATSSPERESAEKKLRFEQAELAASGGAV